MGNLVFKLFICYSPLNFYNSLKKLHSSVPAKFIQDSQTAIKNQITRLVVLSKQHFNTKCVNITRMNLINRKINYKAILNHSSTNWARPMVRFKCSFILIAIKYLYITLKQIIRQQKMSFYLKSVWIFTPTFFK